MKLIIAGSRTINPSVIFVDSIICNNDLKVTEIISGTAGGVDRAGERYAIQYNEMGIRYHNPTVNNLKLTKFPADWEKFGKAAGHIRNKQMADYADALLLIWDGTSSGSKNMKETMLKLGKPVYEVILRTHNAKE